MATRTIIIWLAVALLLGGAALLVVRRPQITTPAAATNAAVPIGAKVLDLDPAALRALTVRTPDSRTQRVERAPEPGEWNLILTDAAGAPSAPWPVLPTRVRSILSLLSTLTAEGLADPTAPLGPDPTIVTLELDSGAIHTLRLAQRTLGGTGLIELQTPDNATRRALVSDSVLNVFRNPGPRAWRNAAALPGVGPDASRIRLENEDRAILLVRTAGRWNLAEPVSAPANPAKVTQILSALEKLTITDFLDDRAPDAGITRLDRPAARIRVETDQRLPSNDPAAAPTVRTRTQQLLVGGPADSSGRHLFVAVGPPDAPRPVSVDATNLATVLTADPAAYIAPSATPTLAADVGSLSLSTDPAIQLDSSTTGPLRRGERRFKRSLGAWADVLADGRESQLADGDVNAVSEVLTFLSTRIPQSTATTAPDGYAPAGAIVLGSLAGAPLDSVEVGAVPSGALALRSGDVYRTYSPDATPRLLRDWLATAGARIGPAPALPLAPGEDINK